MRRAHVPNATLQSREVLAALLRPMAIDAAELRIADLTGSHAVLFASARGALAALVADLAGGGQVAVPGYTCVAVANAVRSGGATARFVDVDEAGLVPAGSWPDADLVLVQDTYGWEAELPEEAVVLRDATHRPVLQSAGCAAVVTSFEHSKWLTAGQGGLVLTGDGALAGRLRERRDAAPTPGPARWRHGLVTLLTQAGGARRYAGRRRTGDRLDRLARRLAPERLAGQTAAETAGAGVDSALLGPPTGTSAALAVQQLASLGEIAEHRSGVVAIYDRACGLARAPEPLLRYPMTVDDPLAFEDQLRLAGWDVSGRWFTGPLHPARTDLAAFGVEAADLPVAARLAERVVNLPTHPLVTRADAEHLIALALATGARPLTRASAPAGSTAT